jgi:hypothetical protein
MTRKVLYMVTWSWMVLQHCGRGDHKLKGYRYTKQARCGNGTRPGTYNGPIAYGIYRYACLNGGIKRIFASTFELILDPSILPYPPS